MSIPPIANEHQNRFLSPAGARRTRRRVLVAVCLGATWLAACSSPVLADRILLRNLTTLSEPVAQFDEDGVRLASGKVVTWDEIESGTVAADKQKAFDAMREKLGPPLFRIRQRLDNGDYEGQLAFAEQVYPLYAARNTETAYMVCQGVMWGRLAAGRREEAVEPYLRCLQYLIQQKGKATGLPGQRRLRVDLATGVSPELLPVWFDAEAAGKVLPSVKEAIRTMPVRPLGTYVMYATLALAAGKAEEGKLILGYVNDPPALTPAQRAALAELRSIALAQDEVQSGKPDDAIKRLAGSLDSMQPQTKPLAQYWIGMARLASSKNDVRRQGVLDLLYLPAVYGKDFPELAAGGLYHAMQALEELNDASGNIALRKELLTSYAGTYYGTKVKASSAVSGKK